MTKRKQSDPREAMKELGWLSEQLNGPLINLELIDVAKANVATQEGRAKGGAAAAKSRTEWHAECVTAARRLLAEDRSLRSLAGILAERFNRDPKTIRDVLKKAGIR